MTASDTTEPFELSIRRVFDATPAQLFRAWSDPELVKQWFVPRPWTISAAEIDLRAGGIFRTVMRSPEGEEMPNVGVFLEVVPNRRIVFTDAYTQAWVPSARPFFTALVEMEADGPRTHYTAKARHWTREALEEHRQMGFESGWSQVAEQLGEVAQRLRVSPMPGG